MPPPDDGPKLTSYEMTILAELEAGARRRIKRRKRLVYLPRALAIVGLGNLGARLIQGEQWMELALLLVVVAVFMLTEWINSR